MYIWCMFLELYKNNKPVLTSQCHFDSNIFYFHEAELCTIIELHLVIFLKRLKQNMERNIEVEVLFHLENKYPARLSTLKDGAGEHYAK